MIFGFLKIIYYQSKVLNIEMTVNTYFEIFYESINGRSLILDTKVRENLKLA